MPANRPLSGRRRSKNRPAFSTTAAASVTGLGAVFLPLTGNAFWQLPDRARQNSATGQTVQVLGIAKSATELIFAPGPAITLA